MNMSVARVMAIFVTGIALVMSGVAGWYRGSSLLDCMLLISISIAICSGCHLIPSISRSPLAWTLWGCCFIGAMYSHLTFFSYISLRAGENRLEHSVQVAKVEQQITAARDASKLIIARPLATVASELAITKSWRKRNALVVELSEAKRSAALQDEIVRLLAATRVAEVTSATDPVTAGIAKVMGTTEQSIAIFSALGFSALIEIFGAFLWYQSFKGGHEETRLLSNSPAENKSVVSLKHEIAAGKVKPTVKAIRASLRCSQARAMEVRREIVNER
jgi:hypothetical protein